MSNCGRYPTNQLNFTIFHIRTRLFENLAENVFDNPKGYNLKKEFLFRETNICIIKFEPLRISKKFHKVIFYEENFKIYFKYTISKS